MAYVLRFFKGFEKAFLAVQKAKELCNPGYFEVIDGDYQNATQPEHGYRKKQHTKQSFDKIASGYLCIENSGYLSA